MSARTVLGFVCSLPLMLQSAQHYPAKPVRVIEPFGAGGGPDLVARAVRLAERRPNSGSTNKRRRDPSAHGLRGAASALLVSNLPSGIGGYRRLDASIKSIFSSSSRPIGRLALKTGFLYSLSSL
jgi:hypothetical protein